MKKFLAIALASLLIFALVGCKNQADDTTDGGDDTQVVTTNVYENFKYDVNEDGELEITGYLYTGIEPANVQIPAEIDGRAIVGIGKEAFKAHKNIASVAFPASILYIDEYAFADCDYLTEVTFPQNLTTIGTGAFANCDTLAKVTFPASLLSIGMGAFDSCVALSNFTLPAGLLTIEDGAFRGCISLTNVTIPASLIDLGDGAFYACKNLYEVNLLGEVSNADDAILAKMNGVLATHTGEAPKTVSEAKAILQEAGLYLGTTTDRGAKFVWDVSTNEIYGAFTAADAALLTTINPALKGKTFSSLDVMIALLKQDGIYVNNLNACVESDKYVFDAEKNEFTTVYLGKIVFNNCTSNTIVSVTEGSAFADFAEKNGYITVAPATAPEGMKIFSNNALQFCYPQTLALSIQPNANVTLKATGTEITIASAVKDLTNDHTAWTNENFADYIASTELTLAEGEAITGENIAQSTNANGVKITKITFSITASEQSTAHVIYLVTVGNTTFTITLLEATPNAALQTSIEASFADVR